MGTCELKLLKQTHANRLQVFEVWFVLRHWSLSLLSAFFIAPIQANELRNFIPGGAKGEKKRGPRETAKQVTDVGQANVSFQ